MNWHVDKCREILTLNCEVVRHYSSASLTNEKNGSHFVSGNRAEYSKFSD